jgi:hypothetical protein
MTVHLTGTLAMLILLHTAVAGYLFAQYFEEYDELTTSGKIVVPLLIITIGPLLLLLSHIYHWYLDKIAPWIDNNLALGFWWRFYITKRNYKFEPWIIEQCESRVEVLLAKKKEQSLTWQEKVRLKVAQKTIERTVQLNAK